MVLDPTAVTDPAALPHDAVAGGVTAVQVRSPGATATRRRTAVAAALETVAGTGVAVIVDDDLETALVTGADGVHLGQHDLDPRLARRRAGGAPSIGWSVSRPEHVRAATAFPAGTVDLLGAGPVFATATKPDAAAPTGLDGLAALVDLAALPVVALGGITADNADAVLATGVDGLAVSSAVVGADQPRRAAATLRDAVERRRASR